MSGLWLSRKKKAVFFQVLSSKNCYSRSLSKWAHFRMSCWEMKAVAWCLGITKDLLESATTHSVGNKPKWKGKQLAQKCQLQQCWLVGWLILKAHFYFWNQKLQKQTTNNKNSSCDRPWMRSPRQDYIEGHSHLGLSSSWGQGGYRATWNDRDFCPIVCPAGFPTGMWQSSCPNPASLPFQPLGQCFSNSALRTNCSCIQIAWTLETFRWLIPIPRSWDHSRQSGFIHQHHQYSQISKASLPSQSISIFLPLFSLAC